MTRIAVLADIHGNLPALEAVSSDMQQFQPDHVIVAGDVVGRGPYALECLDYIARQGWPVIRGNHEYHFILDYASPRHQAKWDTPPYSTIAWSYRQIPPAWISRIGCWPDTLALYLPNASLLRVVHGSPRSVNDKIAPKTPDTDIAHMLRGVEEATVVAAHTHIPLDRRVGNWHIVNPGSVGQPCDGIFQAGYMLLDADTDGWQTTLRRVPFDFAALMQGFAHQRLVEECGPIGRLLLEEFRTCQERVRPFWKWAAEHCPRAPFTMTLVETFLQQCPMPSFEGIL